MANQVQANIVLGNVMLNSVHVADDSVVHGGPNYLWYEMPTSGGDALTDSARVAQVFVASVGFTCTSAKIQLSRGAGTTGTVTCALYATDANNLPTGSALKSDTMNVADLSLTATWETFTWADQAFAAGTDYAVACYTSSGASSVTWDKSSIPIYNIGQRASSVDSGSSWSADTTACMKFVILPDYISNIKCFVTDISEDGGSYTIHHNTINRTGGVIQRAGSPSRKWTISGYIEGTNANIEQLKTALENGRVATTSYELHIEQINSDTNSMFVSDLNVFVTDVRWPRIEAGATYDKWVYEVELMEDTN